MSLDRHSDKMIAERKGRTVNHGKEAIEMALQRIASVAKILRKGAIVMLRGRSQLSENLQGDFSILQQISALRRENRFLKFGLIFCLVLSALPYLTGFQPETISAKKVVTERIEFVRDGEKVTSITTSTDKRELEIKGKDDKTWVDLGDNVLGGMISVRNKDGVAVVAIVAFPIGGMVSIADKNEKPAASIMALPDSNQIILCNKDGKMAASMGSFSEGNQISVCNKDGKLAALMGSYPELNKIDVRDEDGKVAVAIGSFNSNRGIVIYNKNGRAIWSAP
jgi:hypothetical protein